MNPVTTEEAAERLGVTSSRVRQFIREGRLPAKKMGRDYFVDPKDLAQVKNRKPGRPKNAQGTSSQKRTAKQSRDRR